LTSNRGTMASRTVMRWPSGAARARRDWSVSFTGGVFVVGMRSSLGLSRAYPGPSWGRTARTVPQRPGTKKPRWRLHGDRQGRVAPALLRRAHVDVDQDADLGGREGEPVRTCLCWTSRWYDAARGHRAATRTTAR